MGMKSKNLPMPAKRKREDQSAGELEIDLGAPEPPSKKALRRAKKGKPPIEKPKSPSPPPLKPRVSARIATSPRVDAGTTGETANDNTETKDPERGQAKQKPREERSEYGTWIGNLPWSVNKEALRTFLVERGGLEASDITRVHMPTPADRNAGSHRKAYNKGFAYVDFASAVSRDQAIALSETPMGGRPLLIKDAQSFAGRPEGHSAGADEKKSHGRKGHPPSKRVFVGNLHFETEREELRQHFEQCGSVEQVFIATFEDSGKCKGYGWITFGDLDASEAAVRGWVDESNKTENGTGEDGSEATTKHGGTKNTQRKPDRHWVNVFMERRLRVEFAEDATMRYQKRFGKGGNKEVESNDQ